jgi:hypothetical protein
MKNGREDVRDSRPTIPQRECYPIRNLMKVTYCMFCNAVYGPCMKARATRVYPRVVADRSYYVCGLSDDYDTSAVRLSASIAVLAAVTLASAYTSVHLISGRLVRSYTIHACRFVSCQTSLVLY